MPGFSLTVDKSTHEGIVVARISGCINSTSAPQLDAEFGDIVDQGHVTIVIDLSATEFISSSGIGVLLGTTADLRKLGGDMILMNVPKLIDDILAILNIKNYFRTITDVTELQPTR